METKPKNMQVMLLIGLLLILFGCVNSLPFRPENASPLEVYQYAMVDVVSGIFSLIGVALLFVYIADLRKRAKNIRDGCSNCGSIIENNQDKFCRHCGAMLADNKH